jgi:hypothetical protein
MNGILTHCYPNFYKKKEKYIPMCHFIKLIQLKIYQIISKKNIKNIKKLMQLKSAFNVANQL